MSNPVLKNRDRQKGRIIDLPSSQIKETLIGVIGRMEPVKLKSKEHYRRRHRFIMIVYITWIIIFAVMVLSIAYSGRGEWGGTSVLTKCLLVLLIILFLVLAWLIFWEQRDINRLVKQWMRGEISGDYLERELKKVGSNLSNVGKYPFRKR